MNIAFLGDSLTEGNIAVSYLKKLKKELPNHNLINYGKNGDTVVALYKRARKIDFTDIDVAFVWIGTNDVLVKMSPFNPMIKTIFNVKWTKDQIEFIDYYKKILDLIDGKVKKIFTVSLLFLGEDPKNNWNKELDELSEIIKDISKKYKTVEYIDLKKKFKLDFPEEISEYLPIKSSRILFDGLFVRGPKSIDELASKRNLRYTVDGAHLNSTGAGIVADCFKDKILIFTNTRK